MNEPVIPKFSIVIPTYNRREVLSRAIQSIVNQSFSEWELIVVDDGSSDGTDAMILAIEDHRIEYVQQGQHGVSSARNRGIEWARAPWIAFLDSDDEWLPGKLQSVADAIENCSDRRMFHTQEQWLRNGQEVPQLNKHAKPSENAFEALIPICCIAMSTVVVHRSVVDEIGMFDESFPVCEDHDWLLRVAAIHEPYLLDDVLTIKYGGHDDQLSATKGMDYYRIKALAGLLSGSLSDERRSLVYQELCRKADVFMSGARKHGNESAWQQCQQWLDAFRSDA